MSPIAIPASELLNIPTREMILLAGKDGVGKTSAVLSIADFWSQLYPENRFFVIDTENKIRATLQTWGGVPSNLTLYRAESMNEVNEAFDEIMSVYKPNDWLAVESAARIWERAQDMGYQAIKGMDKAGWMEKRRQATGDKKPPVTPDPSELWSIIKGAHDKAFMDVMAAADDLNVILSTTVSKVKEDRSNRKENPDRKALRAEHGIDVGIDGAPRLPYYVQTFALLEKESGTVSCRILRDNMSKLVDPAISFDGFDRKNWATSFWAETAR